MARKKFSKRKPGGKNFREEAGLSQQQIADYLDVSKGLYAMYETSQRNLPGNAGPKIAELIMTYYTASAGKKQGRSMLAVDEKLRRQEDEMGKDAENLAVIKRFKSNRLQPQIKELVETQQQLSQWLNIVDHKLEEDAGKLSKKDRTWFEFQQSEVAAKLLQNNLALQKLQLKSDHLQASADIHERHQQRLLDKKNK